MENKYYIPEIEELHIGFEYEVKLNNGNWEQHSLHVLSELNFESKSIEELNIRVKHLNRIDIESLGWNHSGHTINEWYIPKEDTEYKLTLYSDNVVRITDRYPNGITSLDKEEQYIYNGEIKNKSELQKLMKRLWII